MLQKDPELFQLYKDLVVSQIVTSDEFWANRANVSDNSMLCMSSLLYMKFSSNRLY